MPDVILHLKNKYTIAELYEFMNYNFRTICIFEVGTLYIVCFIDSIRSFFFYVKMYIDSTSTIISLNIDLK